MSDAPERTPRAVPTREALEALRRKHLVVEDDCWYSCPKSGECCYPVNAKAAVCICGADAHNARLDAILVGWDALYAENARLAADAERLRALQELVADEVVWAYRGDVFVGTDDDSRRPVEYSVSCNGFFAPAADGEPLSPSDAVALNQLVRERPAPLSPHDVAMAWVSERRGGAPHWRNRPIVALDYVRAARPSPEPPR